VVKTLVTHDTCKLYANAVSKKNQSSFQLLLLLLLLLYNLQAAAAATVSYHNTGIYHLS